MNEDIKVTFIIPKDCTDENDCSEEMQLAFIACQQHSGGGLQAEWIHEHVYDQFEGLTKKDVLVLSEFSGELYNKLSATKCLLVGPRCLSCCLTEGVPIPSGPEPVFTVAMRGLVITASGLSKQKKEEIKRKIHWMGGIYTSVLSDENTHLVSDTVLSDKYTKSVEKGLPVMAETWIEAVWEASLRLNVNAASSDFFEHKLPPFANLQVTTSGISKKEKQKIMKMITENGGVFTGAFQSETTDLVILTKEGVGSEKHKAAVEYKKPCVVPQWVVRSVQAGAALSPQQYRVPAAATSSPLAGHSRLPDISLNFSRITCSRPPNNFVEESRVTDISTVSAKMKLSQEVKKVDVTSADKEIIDAFENFDMSLIKRAGSIFDGFCIYVVGVGSAAPRAWSLVSRCGGVRYEAPHSRVTHAVCGTRAAAAAAASQVPGVPLLSPKWLLDSVAAGVALPEIDYLIESEARTPVKIGRPRPEASSPMSRRNLQLLLDPPAPAPGPAPAPAPAPMLPPPPPAPLDDDPQDNIINQYLSQKQDDIEPPDKPRDEVSVAPDQRKQNITDDVTYIDQPTEDMEIFKGVVVEVQGLEEEAVREVGAELRGAGAELRGAGGGGQYVLVPLDYDTDELINKRAEPVTVFWIKDCLSQGELVELQYYHRPVRVRWWSEEAPLAGVVASLSTYSGVERAFLDELAKLLGATTQLRFCRRAAGSSLACTHLVCPLAAGDKYRGAARWGLPALTGAWLLHSAAAGRRLPEEPYLVTEAKPPAVTEDATTTDEQQTNKLAVEHTDKENEELPPQDAPIQIPPPTEQTPTGKPALGGAGGAGGELSPASRYIAMARQGLLAGDSQHTPHNMQRPPTDLPESAVSTPPLLEALSSGNLRGLSPTTRRRLLAVRRGEMPSDPVRTPQHPARSTVTPESTFGAALRPGATLSPEARKRLWNVVDNLPNKLPAPTHNNTPLSEIRNRFLAQFTAECTTPTTDHQPHPRKLLLQDQTETPPAKMAKFFPDQSACSNLSFGKTEVKNTSERSVPNGRLPPSEIEPCNKSSKACSPVRVSAAVEEQLQRLNAALTGRSSATKLKRNRDSVTSIHTVVESEAGPASQPNTVGWDDSSPAPVTLPAASVPDVKYFMLSSNVDNREEVEAMICGLGGVVCAGAALDARATHLLCAVPGRSEKMLASVAAGRRVLHPLYVLRSHQRGHLLQEDEYEWGNPAAKELPKLSESEQILANAAYRWRVRRSNGGAGPFHGMVAILHVPPPRRDLLARLVQAGGGRVSEQLPPYSDTSVTVCFAEPRRLPLEGRDAAWLRTRRLPVCPPVLLSSFLTDQPPPDPALHCLPEFTL